MKIIKLLTFILFTNYSLPANSEWVKIDQNYSYENATTTTYVKKESIVGKYWIRRYSVMIDTTAPYEIKVDGQVKSILSTVHVKELDCLFGNAAYKNTFYYSANKANGNLYGSDQRREVYDYRWFQIGDEYNDNVVKFVCGDLYSLRDWKLFQFVDRQSPM